MTEAIPLHIRNGEEAGNAGTPEEALRIAHMVTQDPNRMDEALKLKHDSVEKAVRSTVTTSTTWGEWVFGKEAAGNQNYVSGVPPVSPDMSASLI